MKPPCACCRRTAARSRFTTARPAAARCTSTPACATAPASWRARISTRWLDGGFDAILTNAGGCGSTLKEYDELLEHEPAYAERARRFVALMKDVNEFLASIELNPRMGEVRGHRDLSGFLPPGARPESPLRSAPAAARSVPGLTLKEMPLSDLCCGSAGIYNVVHTDMAHALLEKKMETVNATGAERIATANPGCMLQLRAGVERTATASASPTWSKFWTKPIVQLEPRSPRHHLPST